MKKWAIALSVLAVAAVLGFGFSAQAETIDYWVTGWQSTCSATWHTGTSTGCTVGGSSVGRLSGGTITGSAQFVGDSAAGTLTVYSSIYITSVTPGVGPIALTDSGGFYLADYGDPEGLTVTGTFLSPGCTPSSDPFCTILNTAIPPSNIDIFGPGNTYGGTVQYMVTAPAAGLTQGYTLTVVIPEPGTALLLGVGLVALAVSGRRRH